MFLPLVCSVKYGSGNVNIANKVTSDMHYFLARMISFDDAAILFERYWFDQAPPSLEASNHSWPTHPSRINNVSTSGLFLGSYAYSPFIENNK